MQMKHGDKAKAKAAKASKPSDKKSSTKAVSKSGKAETKGGKAAAKGKAGSEKAASSKKSGSEAVAALSGKTGGNGRGRPAESDGGTFANPVVAAAFKRAVKKYPNSFRRLTD
jgi:hypothetical protein